ncbi:MAG TPA: methyltransferase domain-containing protein [Chthonomonadaceae bacterium]|nr:methyltransferase domain-containing protein [Chthonomonadaceae bacterium]
MTSSPFQSLAGDYDRAFTDSLLGRRMRQAVWRRLEARFAPGDRILELNCGTGEDALYLAQRGVFVLATDAAPDMLRIAQAKIRRAGAKGKVRFHPMQIEALAGAAFPYPEDVPALGFDGALSNFGGLNCVSGLDGVAAGLARCLRPGGVIVLCVMGPFCPWEWGWFLRQRQPGKAFRRLRPGGVSWRGLTVSYPTIRKVRRAFAPHFRLLRAAAIGALLPPPYTESWIAQHVRLLDILARWERRVESLPILPALADHYLLEFERV